MDDEDKKEENESQTHRDGAPKSTERRLYCRFGFQQDQFASQIKPCVRSVSSHIYSRCYDFTVRISNIHNECINLGN